MSDSETPKLVACLLPRPAGYTSTDSAEIEALNVFRAALDVDRVKLDLKERDRHPNIDGYVELVDDSYIPLES